MSDPTWTLKRVPNGESKTAEEFLPLVYEDLRRLAAARMAQLPSGQTLQATALVHEAYLRLIGSGPQDWNNQGHFFSAAAEAMRRILVERARQKGTLKRGAGSRPLRLDDIDIAIDSQSDLLLALNEALTRYAERDPLGAELIKLRFFAGLPNDRAAALLNVPERTAKRIWAYARAWLYHEVQKSLH